MKNLRGVLLRIDDIGKPESLNNTAIYELCKAGYKVTCAVVPLWLSQETIDFLLYCARSFPGTLEIHQHGYTHINHGDSYHKYEYGSGRSLQEQENTIREGKAILQQAFGDLFFPAFTPPYGEYDENTLQALAREGFPIMSTFADVESNGIILDVAPTIDCFEWDPPREWPWEAVAYRWQRGSRDSLEGLILHPRLMSEESLQAYLFGIPKIIGAAETVHFREIVSEHNRRDKQDRQVI